MKLEEVPVEVEELIVSPEQTAVRTEGYHVSGIIRKLYASIKPPDSTFTEAHLSRFALLGRLFEYLLALSMFRPPRYERLGELEVDGIIGSPDAYDTEEGVIVEIKVTWKSSRRDITAVEFWPYWKQIMAYCYMAQVRRAVLIVLFICGDWKPMAPQLRRWNIEFTQAELNECWAMLQANKGE